jgi:hypothetical protein
VVGHTTINVRLLESEHKAVCTKFDILTHETHILSEKVNGDSVTYELVLNVESIADDRADATRSCREDKSVVKKACKAAMQTFITAMQFI